MSGLAELERLGINHADALRQCQSPFSGLAMLEPQGSRRGEALWQLDLQFGKGFRIGEASLQGIVSVFNVFADEAATEFIQDPFDSLGLGAPYAWQNPRRWELGFRIEF